MYPYVNIHIFHHFVDINYMNFNILNELPSYSLASRDAPIPEKRPILIFLEGRYRYQLILNLRLGLVKLSPKPVKLDSAFHIYVYIL